MEGISHKIMYKNLWNHEEAKISSIVLPTIDNGHNTESFSAWKESQYGAKSPYPFVISGVAMVGLV